MENATPENKEEADNVIFIGSKSFINYVTGIVVQFTTKKQKEVVVKARGKFITKAIDVVEFARKRYLQQDKIEVKNIAIDSEEFENQHKKKVIISTIEITLTKG